MTSFFSSFFLPTTIVHFSFCSPNVIAAHHLFPAAAECNSLRVLFLSGPFYTYLKAINPQEEKKRLLEQRGPLRFNLLGFGAQRNLYLSLWSSPKAMPGEPEELGEECSLSGDEKTCLIGILLLLVSRLFSLLSLRWSRIRTDDSHFLLELRRQEEGEVRLDKQLHSAVEEDLSIGNSKSSSGEDHSSK